MAFRCPGVSIFDPCWALCVDGLLESFGDYLLGDAIRPESSKTPCLPCMCSALARIVLSFFCLISSSVVFAICVIISVVLSVLNRPVFPILQLLCSCLRCSLMAAFEFCDVMFHLINWVVPARSSFRSLLTISRPFHESSVFGPSPFL